MAAQQPLGPLAGFRVVEVCHMLAGPYCGMILADLGAEVIKIEVGEGDTARAVGENSLGEHNLYFASLNRNKQSVLLDLTSAADRPVFEALIAGSHGLVTNLRPSAIRKLGLTYESLKGLNPKLACLALTGFGLEGPYSDYPAYDYIIQAMTGVMMLTGEPGSPPVRAGYSVVDNTGGMMGAIGLMAKLLEGRGGQVDVALYDVMLSQLNYLGSQYLNAGEAPQRYASGAHPFFVPAQIFATATGHISVFITHDGFWRAFATELGRADWVTDPKFATMHARSKNRELVLEQISAELRRCSSQEWVERLRPLGVVVAEVATMADALASENTRERHMIIEAPTDDGVLRLIGNPIKVAGYADRLEAPPKLGEHTALYRIPATAKPEL